MEIKTYLQNGTVLKGCLVIFSYVSNNLCTSMILTRGKFLDEVLLKPLFKTNMEQVNVLVMFFGPIC
jgi:hypothetical protein